MKTLLETLIRRRNPQFKFDESITIGIILSLLIQKSLYFLRGLRVLMRARKPDFLLLGRRVKFFNLKNIKWGQWVKFEHDILVSALGKGKIVLGQNTSIGAFSRLIISTSFNNIGSHIHLGENVGIGEFAYLGGAGGLSIGNDCIIGQYFSCHPENHNYKKKDTLIRHQGTSRSGISIGNDCWIGSKVTICDGVKIGDHCVIAAGAVVTKDMPSNSVIGGVPAKVLKTRLEYNNANQGKRMVS
jgi:acetyltransferase-like isoleucine patch superfamily enzyme